MKTTVKILLVCMLCSVSLLSKAQLIYDDKGLSLGRDSYTPLYFGDKWSLEYYDGGLNVYRAYPYSSWGNYKMFVDSLGRVGIGRKPTSYRLEVAGDVWVDGVYRTSSDERLKTNIQSLSNLNCLEKIQQLNGKSYNKRRYPIFNKQEEINKMLIAGKITDLNKNDVLISMEQEDSQISDKKQFGFIAQEIQQVFPALVFEDENGYLSVDYAGIIPVLIEALKEQQVIINKQKEELLKALNDLESINN